MPKTITGAELAKLKEMGATITRERREMAVPALEALGAEFKAMMADKETRAEARHQRLVAAVEGLTRAVTAKSVPVQDLRPVLEQILELQRMAMIPPARPEYAFEIQRNSRGYMSRVVAKPVVTEH